jgi:branched-chain amino acid transport system permease protein
VTNTDEITEEMTQFLANGLCNAAVYALVAVGFGLVFSGARVFHVAHGAVYTAGAFVAWALLVPLHLPLAAAVAGGVLAAAILGMLVETIVYYPLISPRRARRASASALMVSSLGAYTVTVNLIAILAGNDTKILRPGVEKTVTVCGAILTHVQVAQLLCSIVGLAGVWALLKFTHLGRTVRALADDPELAGIMGHNVRRVRLALFALGSALAGAAGILTALDVGVDPQVGFHAVLVAAVATIVGGYGRLLAPALGALVLGVLQSLVVWQTSQKWSSAVVFGVLVVVLLVKPSGLLSSRKRLEEA